MALIDVIFDRLGRFLRLIVPLSLLGGFIMAGFVNIPIPVLGNIRPFFVLMYVYYWAIYRPLLVPPVLCFSAGILMDVLASLPLGMNAIILVAVRWLVSDQRRFLMGQPYMAIWAAFALVTAGVSLVQWLLFCLVAQEWMSVWPMLASGLITFLLFPLITLLLIGIHRVLPVASRGLA